MKTKQVRSAQDYRIKKVLLVLISILFLSKPLLSKVFERSENFNSIKIESTGKGKIAIFLPPLACTPDVWDATIENVFASYQCFKINLPGYAGQKALTTPDFEIVLNDIIAYIKSKNLKDIVLVGHSFGGSLALRLALSQPESFSKLIIVDAYPFTPGLMQPTITLEQAKMQAGMIENQLKTLPDSVFSKQQVLTYSSMIQDKSLADKIVKEVLQSDKNTICRAYYEMFSTDLRDSLETLKMEVLVLASWKNALQMGKDKQYIQEILKSQYKKLVNCEILIAEDANHFIMLDEPEWFYLNIKKFIE